MPLFRLTANQHAHAEGIHPLPIPVLPAVPIAAVAGVPAPRISTLKQKIFTFLKSEKGVSYSIFTALLIAHVCFPKQIRAMEDSLLVTHTDLEKALGGVHLHLIAGIALISLWGGVMMTIDPEGQYLRRPNHISLQGYVGYW